jgi:hypothetical protein
MGGALSKSRHHPYLLFNLFAVCVPRLGTTPGEIPYAGLVD